MKIGSLAVTIILFIGSSLDAYSLYNVPIEWIVNFIGIILSLFIIDLKNIKNNVYIQAWIIFVYVSLVLNCLFILSFNGNISSLYPSNSNTGYIVYILLRFLTLILSINIILIILNLTKIEYEKVNRVIVIWGGIIALYAVYSYLAVIYDLPTFYKNRMSTSGGEQKDFFTNYIINRATGTFREPAFLGVWLLLPFFLSLRFRSKFNFLIQVVIFLTVLLTGSVTAYVSFTLSIIIYFILRIFKNDNQGKKLNIYKLLTPFSLMLFLWFSMILFLKITELDINVYASYIWNRIEPLIYGMNFSDTNRADPYLFIEEKGIPWIGNGLGNSNLLLTSFKGTTTISSFLSIYINYLFALGISLSPILIFILFFPGWLCVKRFYAISVELISLYVAVMIVGIVLYQEFTILLIYTFSFVIYESKKSSF